MKGVIPEYIFPPSNFCLRKWKVYILRDSLKIQNTSSGWHCDPAHLQPSQRLRYRGVWILHEAPTEMDLLVVGPDFVLHICLYFYVIHSITASKSDTNQCAVIIMGPMFLVVWEIQHGHLQKREEQHGTFAWVGLVCICTCWRSDIQEV